MVNVISKISNGCRWRIKHFVAKQKSKIDFGSLRKLAPVSQCWGLDRGTPVDRYYIGKFLEQNKDDIKGAVLEFQNSHFTKKFGEDRIDVADTIDNAESNITTINADLRDTDSLPRDKYDCIICTQVLQLIDDTDLCIKNMKMMLKDDGVLLCTVPTTSKIAFEEDFDFWRFTKAGAKYVFEKNFDSNCLHITAYGNAFINTCFIQGIVVEDITRQ